MPMNLICSGLRLTRDVVVAVFGVVLDHLARQQRSVAPEQRAQAGTHMARTDQLGDEGRGIR